MPLTPETLTRHELNGLPVWVAAADNPDLVGIAGRVVSETRNTLRIETDAEAEAEPGSGSGSRVKTVPKRGTTFEFRLVGADESARTEARAGEEPTRTDERAAEGAARTDDRAGERPAHTEERAGERPARTDEAAAGRKAAGSASERESETPGVRPGQSGSTLAGSPEGGGDAAPSGDCEDAVYVTVDGATLLSRPAHRTENADAGDSQWQ